MRVRSFLGVLVLIAFGALGSAWAGGPGERGKDYLALGDSVAFGYITQAGFEYVNPANFVPYADYAGFELRLDLTDAACPGETTGSFLSSSAPDNGCRAYRGAFPLHVTYSSTQFAFAKSFLEARRDTRLVTISLGANDGFLLEDSCNQNPECIAAGAPQLFATVAANMQTILAGLRATGFKGTIIVVNYYSLDYTDATGTALTAGLNQALSAPAPAFNAVVADVFSAFKLAASSAPASGKTCVAGLLNVNPQNQLLCDVHPSQSGHQLIAKTVDATYRSVVGKGEEWGR
jgi:lysophospholipase L1-like esterase